VPSAAIGLRGVLLAILVAGVALGAAIAIWVWMPPDLSSGRSLQEHLRRVGGHPLAPVGVTVIYALGALIAVPISLLIAATLVVFGLGRGVPYAMLGALASAALTFGIGRVLGELTVRRLFGVRFETVRRRLARCDVITVALVRMLPIAPFSLINVVAGAAGVPFLAFVGGTMIGLAPGLVALALITSGLAAEGGAAAISLGAGIILLVALAVVARRRAAAGTDTVAATRDR
jgi:uncharacterized membrane protein YdjX (TVP38/TMEM64 family)